MTKRPRLALVCAALALTWGLAAAAADTPPAEPRDISGDLAAGRGLAEDFLTGDAASLHGRFTEAFKEEMSLADLQGFQQRTRDKLGAEAEVVDEVIKPKDEYMYYIRRSRFAKGPAELHVLWREGQVAALFVRTPPEEPGAPKQPAPPKQTLPTR
jgi:hypothetical protein